MKFKGILTGKQIKSVPFKRWNKTAIGDVMTPADQLKTYPPQQTADTLLEEMYWQNIDHIPVLEDGKIIGVVARNTLLSLVKTRIEFGAFF